MQGQMAVQISAQHSASTGGGGGGLRKGEPLVTHKLIAPKERPTGNETFEAIDDWYEEMRMDVDLIMPGSQVIMEWAEKRPRQSRRRSFLRGMIAHWL